MDVTTDYVKQKFEEFNNLCFEGKLKPLPFRMSNARTFLGMVKFKRKLNFDATWHYYDFEFVISQKCENTGSEQEVEDVIIHEMIHYYILSNQLHDNGPHGDIFKRMMRDINARYNRHVTISHKKSREESDKDTELRQHIICVVHFRSGKLGIAVVARTRIFELWDKMRLFPDVAEVKWYYTIAPFFNRYPRITKPKLYAISQADLDEHLTTAVRLVRRGNVIKAE